MTLPTSPQKWSSEYQRRLNAELERLINAARKRGTDLTLYASSDGRVERMVLPTSEGWGIQVDPTNPVYPWKDLRGPLFSRTGGNSAPTNKVYLGGIYQYGFGKTPGEVEVFNEFHWPHDYLPGSNVYIHAHWSVITGSTGDVNWMFDAIQAKGYDQAVFEGTSGSGAEVTVSATQSSATAYKHQIAEVLIATSGGLYSPATVNVSITTGTASLTAASALFTAADIGRTVRILGAGGGGADLDTTISAYSSTTAVTLSDNASTTVTTQDAFRYRILDSDDIEVDGLCLTRCWRNASKTADTLNEEPFLHEVDLHYQSTGIGTKGRNGPDFWS